MVLQENNSKRNQIFMNSFFFFLEIRDNDGYSITIFDLSF